MTTAESPTSTRHVRIGTLPPDAFRGLGAMPDHAYPTEGALAPTTSCSGDLGE